VKMAVATILVFSPGVRFGKFKRAAQAKNYRLRVKHEAYVAQEMDRAGGVLSLWKINRATAISVALLDGPVDGGCIIGRASATRAEIPDVISSAGKFRRREIGRRKGIITRIELRCKQRETQDGWQENCFRVRQWHKFNTCRKTYA